MHKILNINEYSEETLNKLKEINALLEDALKDKSKGFIIVINSENQDTNLIYKDGITTSALHSPICLASTLGLSFSTNAFLLKELAKSGMLSTNFALLRVLKDNSITRTDKEIACSCLMKTFVHGEMNNVEKALIKKLYGENPSNPTVKHNKE